ncbi:MAG: ornithine carbamoyltransferase, partial [Bacillota bacterium]
MRHFLQFRDFGADELEHLFRRTKVIKERFKNYIAYQPLVDRMLAMVFEKSSTRTRVSFEAGIHQLGGSSIVLNTGETQLGRGEPIEDVARIITRMVDIVMIRTFEHSIIERFAAHSRVPVINGLTNDYHPCQVLADIFTFIEHRGPIGAKTVAWVGDGNNMCNTWMQAAQIFGFTLHVATPTGYGVDPKRAKEIDRERLKVFADPLEAVKGADLVTTDVWTSMGFEAEAEARRKAFGAFTVDERMMERAQP